MSNNPKQKIVPFYSENIGKTDSFTIAVDAETNQLYTFEEKQMKASVFLPLFLIFLIFTRLLTIEYIPFNNPVIYTTISILLFGVCLVGGNIMRQKGIKNVKKANLNSREWRKYQERGRHFYPRQVLFVCLILTLSIACFVFLYIYQVKWWLVGAILCSLVAGSLLPLLSKTRYLLFKDKIEVDLRDDGDLQ